MNNNTLKPIDGYVQKTYVLTRRVAGKKIEYKVTDEAGTLISKRLAVREYVACTICGSNYFGRVDLVGRGDHGKYIDRMRTEGRDPVPVAYLDNPHTYNVKEGSPFLDLKA